VWGFLDRTSGLIDLFFLFLDESTNTLGTKNTFSLSHESDKLPFVPSENTFLAVRLVGEVLTKTPMYNFGSGD